MNTQNLKPGQEISFTTINDSYYVDGEHHYKVDKFNEKSVWLFGRNPNGTYTTKSFRLAWNTLNKYLSK